MSDLTWRYMIEASLETAQQLEAALEASPLMERTFPPSLSYFEQPGRGDWLIEIFVTGSPEEAAIQSILRQSGLDGARYTLEQLEDRDWVSESQKLLKPVSVGRFFIHGSHDADKAPADKICLEIEAGQAFGTGQHETTWGCLKILDALTDTITPATILDLGTGSGVLALAAERLWPSADILASDIDPVAIDVTRENIIKNGSACKDPGEGGNAIACLVAEGMDHPALAGDGHFDLITANILAGPLIELAGDLVRALRPGGVLILSGLLQTQEEEVLDAYLRREPPLTLFGEKNRVHKGEWSALSLQKPL